MEEMEESKVGGRGHISPYNSIIYGLYLQSRYDEALDFLNKMGKMFPRAVDRTLRILGLCNEGKIAGAKEVYDQMIHEGGVPSVLVYSSLIEGFCEHKQVREAFELMNEMVSRGYIPGTSIYNAIITGFCRQGKIMSALNLVEDIRAKGFLLNVGTFSPLINALCSKGDLRRAMKIFEQMADQAEKLWVATLLPLLLLRTNHPSIMITQNSLVILPNGTGMKMNQIVGYMGLLLKISIK